MFRLVTFFGSGRDNFNYPVPYHRYFILEGPAPWISKVAQNASIQAITDSPLPDRLHFLSDKGVQGLATDDAIAALRELADLQGLTIVES
jgi:hypothetical protein